MRVCVWLSSGNGCEFHADGFLSLKKFCIVICDLIAVLVICNIDPSINILLSFWNKIANKFIVLCALVILFFHPIHIHHPTFCHHYSTFKISSKEIF